MAAFRAIARDGLREAPVTAGDALWAHPLDRIKSGYTASPNDRTCPEQSWKLWANYVRTPGCSENERNSML